MAHDDLLIAGAAAGSTILIAGGSGNLLIAPSTPEPGVTVGGGSGGRSKAKGYKLVSDELGNRPVKQIPSLSEGKLKLRTETISRGRLQIPVKNISHSIVKPFHVVGISISEILIKTRTESFARLRIPSRIQSNSYMVMNTRRIEPELDNLKKAKKLMELFTLYQMAESTDNIFTIPKKVQTFDFEEDAEEWKGVLTEQRFTAFTHSSSFIGNVRYDQDEQSMRIILNGKIYQFCNVPQRIFDSFEGANSKGAYFNRNIKTLFDC